MMIQSTAGQTPWQMKKATCQQPNRAVSLIALQTGQAAHQKCYGTAVNQVSSLLVQLLSSLAGTTGRMARRAITSLTAQIMSSLAHLSSWPC